MVLNLNELTLLKRLPLLLLASTLTFSVSNFFLNGSLKDITRLGIELKSHPDSLYTWKISTEPPFKYRILHKAIVKNIYQIVKGEQDNNKLFFRVYQLMAFIFHSLAIIVFYFFLSQINLRESALLGTILFALMPPLLFAYNLPVHTREDTLGYILLLVGLLSIIKNNVPLVLIVSVLGVLCRETLLILPFINLFFNTKQNIWLRLFISGICFLIFLYIRLHNGTEVYNYWEGFNWNRTNLLQVIGFSFITFGLLWIPFLLSFILKPATENENQIIVRSSKWVLLLIIVTTFMGGIFNEIRLLYLLAPWVIPIGLYYYIENKSELFEFVKSKKFKLFAGVLAVILFAITLYAFKVVSQSFTSQYDIPYLTWIGVASMQSYLVIISLPYFNLKMKGITLKWFT